MGDDTERTLKKCDDTAKVWLGWIIHFGFWAFMLCIAYGFIRYFWLPWLP